MRARWSCKAAARRGCWRPDCASAIGQIGHALATVVEPESPLKRQTAALVRWFAAAAVVLSLAATGLYLFARGNLLEAVLAGLALAMSMLPEEFPVILTVFMAAGAWRISKRNVLTRRINVIETLGAATVLCVDKTGTLTENRMAVQCFATASGLRRLGAVGDVAAAFTPTEQAMLATAVLASEERPFDPMEIALHGFASTVLPQDPADGMTFVHEYPLSARLLAMTHVWRRDKHGTAVVATKGAPESDRAAVRPGRGDAARHGREAVALAGERPARAGRGRARKRAGAAMARRPARIQICVGGVSSPSRIRCAPTCRTRLRECRGAGIRVVMITGDYAATARAIAGAAGLAHGGDRHRNGNRGPRRSSAARVRSGIVDLRAHRSRAETRDRHGAEGQWRDRRDDGRRRQRRARAQGRAHRHRHGQARHRRRARSGRAGAAR